jgi:hypothetical protein
MVVDEVTHLDLQGASRMTGGVLRGRAHGNVFNFADADAQVEPATQDSIMGKVHVYKTHDEPSASKPYMTMKQEVTGNLGPVLTNLASLYSPVKSEHLIS